MKFRAVDHIVISVTNFKRSVKFYSAFLGKPMQSEWDASWQAGDTKLFLTLPYKKSARKFDKHNIGLNHLALRIDSLTSLKKLIAALTKSKVKNSGIIIDKYSNNPMIWLDDPDGIRLEFYFRKSK